MQFLKALSSEARENVECIRLLVQPYEEDCSDDNCVRAYTEFAEYILHHLPGFRKLCLNIWDDEMRLQRAASEFSILLHREGVKIVVGCSWWKGEVQEYTSVRTFLEAVSTVSAGERRGRRLDLEELEGGVLWKEVKGRKGDSEAEEDNKDEGDGGEGDTGSEEDMIDDSLDDRIVNDKTQNHKHDTDSNEGNPIDVSSPKIINEDRQAEASMAKPGSKDSSDTQATQPPQASDRSTPTQETHLSNLEDDSDSDWTEATLSPISPDRIEERSWEVL